MIRFFVNHPTAANLLMIAMIALGILAIPSLRRETFPEFTSDQISVTIAWQGASARDADDAIAIPVAEALATIAELHDIETVSREGVATITAELRDGADANSVLRDVEMEVDATSTIPTDAEEPVIQLVSRDSPVVSIAISGSLSDRALADYAAMLENRLERLSAVSLVDVQGFSDRQIAIELKQSALLALGVSIADVGASLSAQSINVPVGTIVGANEEFVVRVDQRGYRPEDFRDLIVAESTSGGVVRLGQVADIRSVFEDEEARVDFDGNQAALLRVTKTSEQDVIDVFRAVEAFVIEARKSAPPGVTLTLTEDMSAIVTDRLTMLVRNAWQGLILVVLVLWLFFTFRFAFWVAAGLPVSFLAAFFFFEPTGMTINMMTMVALLLALGLLMDDAIVIAENIASHIARGKTAWNAARDGTAEIATGVISSFLTTLVVFGPLTMLDGNIGKVLRVLPIVLILVMSVSLIEAFLILPHHIAHSLHGHTRDRNARWRTRLMEAFEHLQNNVVGRAAELSIRWRYLTIGASIFIFCLSIAGVAGGIVKFQAFPSVEGDQTQVRLMMPQGTPFANTMRTIGLIEQQVDEINDLLSAEQPDGEQYVRHVIVKYGQNSDANESGPHVATVTVDLLSSDLRKTSLEQFNVALRERLSDLPDVATLSVGEASFGPGGRPIEIQILGDDVDSLKAASLAVREWFGQFAGVSDLSDDLRQGKREYSVRPREGLLAAGVTAAALANQLSAAFRGSRVDEVQVDGELYEIIARLDASDRDRRDALEHFRVVLANGENMPLGALAQIEERYDWSRLARVGGQLAVTVTGDVDTALTNTSDLMRQFRQEGLPSILERYPGVSLGLEGESAEGSETAASMGRAFLIGLLGVFIILSYQFRSYVEPLAIMAAIPLALVGVILGHGLLGYDLSMPSMMGFVSLAGVVVNNAILLVEFTRIYRDEGLPVADAIGRAVRSRFRPMVLTSATTIAGLIPLLFETSLQAQVLIPLAISLVFGLAASTFLVLLVIPALYTALDDFGLVGSTKLSAEARAESE